MEITHSKDGNHSFQRIIADSVKPQYMETTHSQENLSKAILGCYPDDPEDQVCAALNL